MNRGQGKAPSQRQRRVSDEIRAALAWTFERGDIRDPILAATPVTITEVRISPDLRNATVFFTPLGGGDAEPMRQALVRVAPYLRHELARQVTLKFVPRLSFQPDTSFDEYSAIDAVFRRPEVQRDLVARSGTDDENDAVESVEDTDDDDA